MSTHVKLPVDHVSDTAYLVAMYRAIESKRKDAVFKDPFAEILSDPKVNFLNEVIPFREEGLWMMTVRTKLLDKHIETLVANGTDTVINLAAGLDTRPYRLQLEPNLLWLEVDLPGIIEYKSTLLSDKDPACLLERMPVDLTDPVARAGFFSYVEKNAIHSIVITEGLLPYLPESNVIELAESLRNNKTVTHWLIDVATKQFIERAAKTLNPEARESKVTMQFAPEEGVKYFEKLGWRVNSFDSFLDGGRDLNRPFPATLISDKDAAEAAHDSGIAVLSKV